MNLNYYEAKQILTSQASVSSQYHTRTNNWIAQKCDDQARFYIQSLK
jgi:hypothetical protein